MANCPAVSPHVGNGGNSHHCLQAVRAALVLVARVVCKHARAAVFVAALKLMVAVRPVLVLTDKLVPEQAEMVVKA